MKTSSAEAPKPIQPKSVLLMGPPGSRKTTLAMQFPGVYIIDCDLNLDGAEKWLRANGRANLAYSYDNASIDDAGSLIDPADCYDRVMMLLTKAKNEPAIKWVVVDSLTACNEYIIRKIMKEQRISYLEARNWSTFKTDAINLVFTKLRHLGKHIIVTAHEVENVKTDPKNIMNQILLGYEPFIQGAVRDMLGGYFTDVWRIQVDLAPGNKTECCLFTDKQPLVKQLKNTMNLPIEIKDPSYEKISKLSGGII